MCFLLLARETGSRTGEGWNQVEKVIKSMPLGMVLSTSGAKARKSLNRAFCEWFCRVLRHVHFMLFFVPQSQWPLCGHCDSCTKSHHQSRHCVATCMDSPLGAECSKAVPECFAAPSAYIKNTFVFLSKYICIDVYIYIYI